MPTSPPRGPSHRGEGSKGHRERPNRDRQKRSRTSGEDGDDSVLIFGIHAVASALENPSRPIKELLVTKNAANRLEEAIDRRGITSSPVMPKDLDRRLGPDTVHQGALAVCDELDQPKLDELVAIALKSELPICVLDQVTDPHNLGAVLRSAAVFGCAGLIATRRHSPPLGGVAAKSASGALELVPVCLVQNLVKALEELRQRGFDVVGLDGAAPVAIEAGLSTAPTVIVLGAEGKGLRQSTREACSTLARISADGPIASLNVSNAAAIALHTHALIRKGVLSVNQG